MISLSKYLKPKNPTSKSGFTLIELVVVIAIISILTALLSVNFVSIRQRGRDAQRKSDLRQIQSALELYRSDQGGYPASITCGVALASGTTTYMQKIPCDPSGTSYSYNGGAYYYNYSSSTATYLMGACLENANDKDTNNQLTTPGGTGSCTSSNWFVLRNP